VVNFLNNCGNYIFSITALFNFSSVFSGKYDDDKNGIFSIKEVVLNICDFIYPKL